MSGRGKVLLAVDVILIALVAGAGFTLIPVGLLDPVSGAFWPTIPSSVRHRAVIEAPGLNGTAEVYWDGWGVPHIFATSEDALYYAFGYVQARDRLWEMDVMRRLAEGRLAELLGEEAYGRDVFFRSIGLWMAANKTYEALEPRYRRILSAFSSGVNRYVREGELPLEYRALGVKPAEWRPVDSIAIGKLIGWSLSGSFMDLALKKLVDARGPGVIRELGILTRPNTLTILSPRELGANRTLEVPLGYRAPPCDAILSWFSGNRVGLFAPWRTASNNWVVDGALTATGRPMLANDPHLALTVPPVWYEAHLVLTDGSLNVRGVTFPGVPVIVIGRNSFLGWGLTNVGADVMDFYYYRFIDDRHYVYKGSVREVETVRTRIAVRVGGRVEYRELQLNFTVHGPLIVREGERYAFRWTGLDPSFEIVAFYLINRARNIAEFEEGLRYFYVPAQNFVYADVEGNIAYWAAGRYPIRSGGAPYLPMNGSDGEGEWVGYIPFSQIPHVINPEKHFVVTANNMPVPPNYTYYLGYEWADRYRAERITELLTGAPGKLDQKYFMKIQNDVHVLAADVFVPMLEEAFRYASQHNLPIDEYEREAFKVLSEWDREARPDEAGPTIFDAWIRELREMVSIAVFNGKPAETLPLEVVEWLIKSGKTEFVGEHPEEALLKAFKRSVISLRARLRGPPSTWLWGKVHRYDIEHVMGGVLKWLNYPREAAKGWETTVNPGRGHNVKSGASWREIFMFNGDCYSVIPGGQSGWRFSPHWMDQLPLWMTGRYKRFTMPSSPDQLAEYEAKMTVRG